MLGGIIKRERLIVVRSALRDVPRDSNELPMRRCPIINGTVALCFLGERQELRRKLAQSVAIERQKVRDPEAVQDREQQQRVLGRLSERFSLFDQQTRPLHSRLGFRRSITFDMHKRRL